MPYIVKVNKYAHEGSAVSRQYGDHTYATQEAAERARRTALATGYRFAFIVPVEG